MSQGQISERSRRVARNTAFLYFRMLLLLLIGLYTSRVVLRQLGVEGYGIYSAVGSVIALANIITGSLGTAIGRYLTNALGLGDMARMKRAFSSSIYVQLLMCAAFLVIIETAGLWYLHTHMDIPHGRMGAADWVLQCSAGILVLQLLSVPYNQTIIAHERMDAYAYISIIEAVLKLGIALLLSFSPFDMLKFYALLMLIAALIVRCAYAWFCRRHFEETRGKLVFDKALTKEVVSFAGWNLMGSGSYAINVHGINLLMNAFFGVAMNAARGVAVTVENTVRAFVSNVLVALNPQITKSYAVEDKEYCFDLACKGAKYAWIIILLVAVPLCFEAPFVLHIWLGEYPAEAPLFCTLALFSLAMDLGFNTLVTVMQAQGDVKRFYVLTSAAAILIFPLVWIAYSLGAPAYTAYAIFITLYVAVDALRLAVVHAKTGLPAGVFMNRVILKVASVLGISLAVSLAVRLLIPFEGWLRLIAVVFASTASICLSAYFIALTPGERQFVKSLPGKIIPWKNA